MKITVIGANGNLGRRVTRQALDRGHQVVAVMRHGEAPDERAVVLKKSLFDMTRQDVEDSDVIISAFGSGFEVDPSVNLDAFRKYIELAYGSRKHLIAIGGAGSLFTDETHKAYEYEGKDYPGFLRGVSMNIKLGIDELSKTEKLNWTAVCPSRSFDPDGAFTGDYLIGTEGEVIYNEEGSSYVTYDDLAKAMLDIAEDNSYQRRKITVATRRGK
ncbi:MAG: NAD(P)H-binding protein [Fusicatenibacter sp.]|nr:NAD(P)H-binding protein [Fusicatenibacter sp.]